MKTFEQIQSIQDAARKVKELNLSFERLAAAKLSRPSPSDPEATDMRGAVVYFMDGDCDVAFYLPVAKALLVHPQPRLWTRANLFGLVTVTI